jgi:Rrf2 family cysteine metabolism transcriptional repressor
MRLSRKGEYGLRAMIVLAANYDKGPLLVQEIAEAELRKAGLLESKRGVGGGYTLIRRPEEVTLAQVFRIIDGPLAPLSCVSRLAHVRCPHEQTCGLWSVMMDVRNAIADVMEGVTLADVCKRGGAMVPERVSRL